VKALREQGKQMNIRKQTLRDWRRQFTSHLRAPGCAGRYAAGEGRRHLPGDEGGSIDPLAWAPGVHCGWIVRGQAAG
jgi:hypothetical protein